MAHDEPSYKRGFNDGFAAWAREVRLNETVKERIEKLESRAEACYEWCGDYRDLADRIEKLEGSVKAWTKSWVDLSDRERGSALDAEEALEKVRELAARVEQVERKLPRDLSHDLANQLRDRIAGLEAREDERWTKLEGEVVVIHLMLEKAAESFAIAAKYAKGVDG